MARVAEDRGAARKEFGATREAVLSALLEQVEELSTAGVAAICAEIPAYAARDERFLADVYDHVHQHYVTILSILLEGRAPTLDDVPYVRGAATRRARAGIALEDFLNAFRVAQTAIWEAIVARAGASAGGHQAVLPLASLLMRYIDFASTHAAHAYVEFQQYVVADADRERRDLLEHLLAGRAPERGPLLAAAERYGVWPPARMLVAASVPVGGSLDADGLHAASAALARAGVRDASTLVVVRQAEIVAVPTLAAGGDPAALCDRLEEVQERLRREGMPLAMGVSTVADGVAELPRAYREACAALRCITEDGGVAALARLSPFQYLALRADDVARRLVDERTHAFLEEDRKRGGVLTATIRAFADADLNLRLAAERLNVHPNTAQYRLGRIEELTGRDLRHVADLIDLIVAIKLEDQDPTRGLG